MFDTISASVEGQANNTDVATPTEVDRLRDYMERNDLLSRDGRLKYARAWIDKVIAAGFRPHLEDYGCPTPRDYDLVVLTRVRTVMEYGYPISPQWFSRTVAAEVREILKELNYVETITPAEAAKRWIEREIEVGNKVYMGYWLERGKKPGISLTVDGCSGAGQPCLPSDLYKEAYNICKERGWFQSGGVGPMPWYSQFRLNDYSSEAVGARLKLVRETFQIDIALFYGEAGVSAKTGKRWEAGKKKAYYAGDPRISRLCNAFLIDGGWLFTGDDAEHRQILARSLAALKEKTIPQAA